MEKHIYGFTKIQQGLNNGEHVNMNATIILRLKQDTPLIANDLLNAHTSTFEAALENEQAAMQYEKGAQETPEIKALNIARNEALTFLMETIASIAKYRKYPQRQKLAQHTQRHLSDYRKLKRENLTVKTGMIKILLLKLDEPELHSAISTLGLQNVVDDLRTTNSALDSLWNERALADARKRKYGSVKKTRKKTDRAFASLAHFIISLHNSGFLPQQAQQKISALIDFLNAEIVAYHDILSRRSIKNISKKPAPDKSPLLPHPSTTTETPAPTPEKSIPPLPPQSPATTPTQQP
jgi:hypothetical protein